MVKLWLNVSVKGVALNNMKKILLASHGKLASGLKSTLEFFLGESENLFAVNAYIDSSDDYLQEIKKFIDSVTEDEAVIFTDIYGGSVNQQVTTLVIDSGKNIPIITSMNLPIVLSIALSEEKVTSELLDSMVAECAPKYVSIQTTVEEGDEEDDFFA